MKKQHQQIHKPEWTILELIQWSASYFNSHDIENPRLTAEILLAHCLEKTRIDLYVGYDLPLLKNELSRFKKMLKRRVQKEPVAYITGSKEFWSMNFNVTRDVLIPRPDTECLVETALSILEDGGGSNKKKFLKWVRVQAPSFYLLRPNDRGTFFLPLIFSKRL